MKKWIIWISSVLIVLAAGALLAFKMTTNPYSGSVLRRTITGGAEYKVSDLYCIGAMEEITQQEALEDLEFAYKYFKRVHPITYKGVPEDLAVRYEAAKADILSKDMVSVNRLCADIESFLAPIGDGHTYAVAVVYGGHYMDYLFPEEDAVVTAVNGETIETLLEKNRDKFSFETERAGLESIYNYVLGTEGLDYLDIDAKKPVIYTFELADGSSVDVTVQPEEFLSREQYQKMTEAENADQEASDAEATPSDEEEYEQELPFVYYDIYEDCSLAVLTLDRCVVNDLYLDTLKKMFTEIKEKGIENVCVDLRNNGGGNSLVTEEFLKYCDVDEFKGWPSEVRKNWYMIHNTGSVHKNHKNKKLLFEGDIYLLTSHDTYSAAKDFAMVIKDNGIGKIVGEASGNNPNSYGDSVHYLLPNSNILLSISYKKWYRIDYKEGFIEPDIPCESGEALKVLEGILLQGN